MRYPCKIPSLIYSKSSGRVERTATSRCGNRYHLIFTHYTHPLLAVRFPPHSSLQILAGPGTGKTRVLTSRVAELVLGHSHSPSSICAVTFTRKASREMKERLHGYLGAGPTEELKLGTFHSVCASYLRTYGPMVHVGPNFLIWDEEECSLLIKYIAESIHKGFAKNLPTAEVYEMFSIAKEQAKVNPKKGIETIIREALEHMMKGEYMSSTQDNPLYELELVLQLYSSYSRVLRESNALDFTDLLIKGLDLFRAIPWAREVSRLKHVLVDEFQDTSSLQYLLVKQLFKTTEGSISVVGDPDQSIYGWRGAGLEVKYQKIDLPQTKVIYLEENYRTTASNIAAAISIISQDKTRPPKTLFTSLTPNGPKPLKKGFPTTTEEEAFISQEINRLIVKSDGIINYGDCAILFRGNYSAGYFAKTLRNAGIPNRQLPELSLNDKFEVKTLLAFLRLAINNAHTPMLIRAMEGPLRVPGKVIANLIGRSVKQNITLFNALERLQSGLDHDTTPSSIEPATLLIQMLRHLKNLRQEGASPVDLIQYTIEATGYYQYLKEEFMDDLWRTKNVELTIKYARNYRASKGSE
ncbi:P-loop containing nucleoside triphosphate hydrolase protein [Rhizoctonia solani]|nr:P-loop containing nucleoside triphosphate hydrolase protein [Rhizoctonia solani]